MLISQQLKYKMTSPCLIYFNLFCLCTHFLFFYINGWLLYFTMFKTVKVNYSRHLCQVVPGWFYFCFEHFDIISLIYKSIGKGNSGKWWSIGENSTPPPTTSTHPPCNNLLCTTKLSIIHTSTEYLIGSISLAELVYDSTFSLKGSWSNTADDCSFCLFCP